jgi:tight adherence protein C
LIDNRVLMIGALALGALLLATIAVMLLLRDMATRSLERRVLSVAVPGGAVGPLELSGLSAPQRMLHWLGELVRRRTKFYSERELLALEGMIASSGLNPQRVLPILLGCKVVAAIGIPLVAVLYAYIAGATASRQILVFSISVPLGLIGPDWVVTLLRRPYLAALRRGVPDALDLLVVCSEAGMGLESALEHVSGEIRHSNPAVSIALTKLLDEMRILPDRREAFRNFADRSGVEGARRLATMLGQSMQYGTPLSQALRTVAIDLRRERMIALEAKAVRLPTLLVLPLIVFIMPSLFIVLAGPAVLRLLDTLHAVATGGR